MRGLWDLRGRVPQKGHRNEMMRAKKPYQTHAVWYGFFVCRAGTHAIKKERLSAFLKNAGCEGTAGIDYSSPHISRAASSCMIDGYFLSSWYSRPTIRTVPQMRMGENL